MLGLQSRAIDHKPCLDHLSTSQESLPVRDNGMVCTPQSNRYSHFCQWASHYPAQEILAVI